MKRIGSTGLALSVLLAATACHKKKEPNPLTSPPAVKLDSENKSYFYAFGAMKGMEVRFNSYPSDEDMSYLVKGFVDGALQRHQQLDVALWMDKLKDWSKQRVDAIARIEKDKAKPIIAAAAKEPNARTLASGVILRTLTPGSGESPKESDIVHAKYKATFVDGKVYDSTDQRNGPLELSITKVAPCWREALLKMKVGERAHIVCPPETFYGDFGNPPQVPPGATIIMESLELVDIAPEAKQSSSQPPPTRKKRT